MVEKMTVWDLKNYLRLRDLKVSGRKPELVARVFAGMENNVLPKKSSAEEVDDQLRADYQAKLLVDDTVIPDPNCLKSGWLGEVDGARLWPCVVSTDLFNFLQYHLNDFSNSDLNDYKLPRKWVCH